MRESVAQRSRKDETQVSGICVYVRVSVCMSTREHVCMCICVCVCAFSCALPLSLLSWDVLKGNTKPRAQNKNCHPHLCGTHERTPPLLQAHMAVCRVLLGVGVWHGVARCGRKSLGYRHASSDDCTSIVALHTLAL